MPRYIPYGPSITDQIEEKNELLTGVGKGLPDQDTRRQWGIDMVEAREEFRTLALQTLPVRLAVLQYWRNRRDIPKDRRRQIVLSPDDDLLVHVAEQGFYDTLNAQRPGQRRIDAPSLEQLDELMTMHQPSIPFLMHALRHREAKTDAVFSESETEQLGTFWDKGDARVRKLLSHFPGLDMTNGTADQQLLDLLYQYRQERDASRWGTGESQQQWLRLHRKALTTLENALLKKSDGADTQQALAALAEFEERRNRLVSCHIRLATNLADRFQDGTVPLADLTQEAHRKMLSCADSFEPDRGALFTTYVHHAIRRHMPRVNQEGMDVVHVPYEAKVRQRLVRRALREVAEAEQNGEQSDLDAAAHKVGTSPKSAQAALRAARRISSLEEYVVDTEYEHIPYHELDSDNVLVAGGFPRWTFARNLVADPGETPEREQFHEELRVRIAEMLGILDHNQRTLLELNFGLNGSKAHSQKELGELFGVTGTAIKLRLVRVMQKLRKSSFADVLEAFVE